MSEQDFDILGELLRLIRSLNGRGVPYALCGGFAVAAHGYVRATTDIDIVITRDRLEEVKEAVREADFYIDNGMIPFPSKGFTFYRMGKILNNEVLMVDILFTEEDSFLWQNRQELPFMDTTVWVLSREALIRMKEGSERTKDKLDIEELRAMDNED